MVTSLKPVKVSCRPDIYDYEFTPAAIGGNEARVLRYMEKGERLLWASAKIVTRSQAGVATSTFQLGDGDDDDDYIGAFNTDQAAGTIVAGAGAFLATSGGKLYTAQRQLPVTFYANTPGNVLPVVRIRVAITKEW